MVVIPEHASGSILGFLFFCQDEGPGYHSCAVSNLLYERRNDAITEVCFPSVGVVNLDNHRESTCAYTGRECT